MIIEAGDPSFQKRGKIKVFLPVRNGERVNRIDISRICVAIDLKTRTATCANVDGTGTVRKGLLGTYRVKNVVTEPSIAELRKLVAG